MAGPPPHLFAQAETAVAEWVKLVESFASSHKTQFVMSVGFQGPASTPPLPDWPPIPSHHRAPLNASATPGRTASPRRATRASTNSPGRAVRHDDATAAARSAQGSIWRDLAVSKVV